MSDVVVIGVGGMGALMARRLGSGASVMLADFNEQALEAVAEVLRDEGFAVDTCGVDVSSASSLDRLAVRATADGPVRHVVHTAGLSPTQAPTDAILRVDLRGVALTLERFAGEVAPGGSGLVIASMAGHTSNPFTPEQEDALRHTPAAELLDLPFLAPSSIANPGVAYSMAKRANQLRVQSASLAWGRRGARINSISPGVIATSMGKQELAGESGAAMRAMVAASATGRLGTAQDITDAAAFLLGPESSFITGTDLLVDGGVIAALRSGALKMG